MLDDQVEAVLAAYPALHAAWRRRGVRDQATGRRVSNHQAGILEQLDPDRVRAALSRLPEREREAAIDGLRALAAAAVALPENAVSRPSTPRRTRRTPE